MLVRRSDIEKKVKETNEHVLEQLDNISLMAYTANKDCLAMDVKGRESFLIASFKEIPSIINFVNTIDILNRINIEQSLDLDKVEVRLFDKDYDNENRDYVSVSISLKNLGRNLDREWLGGYVKNHMKMIEYQPI